MTQNYHRLLQRQIKKIASNAITGNIAEITPADMEKLLQIVSVTYEEYEKSQERSDRAVSLMSDELLQLNKKIRDDAEHEIALSERKYYNIVHNISGIIFTHYWQNHKLIPNFVSPQIGDITGYAPEDFTQGKVDYFSIIHPDDIIGYLDAIQKAYQTNHLYQMEYRIINRSGEEVWLFEQGRVLEDTAGMRTDGVIININKQKQAEQQLMKIAREAEEANRAKSEFLSNMSHELRTPMHSVLSYAELGMSGLELNEPADSIKMCFETISKSGNRLLKLLNSLLDLARMESGKMRYNFVTGDMEQVVHHAVQEINILAEKKSIRLHTEIRKKPIEIWMDCDKIIQVLVNLLSNAIKFTAPGKKVRIFVDESLQFPGYLRIDIIDEGVGIPEEQLESIFNAFVQSSRTSAGAGGTGLGLSITKEIIKAHEGKIYAFNNQKEGSTFRVEMPINGKSIESVSN